MRRRARGGSQPQHRVEGASAHRVQAPGSSVHWVSGVSVLEGATGATWRAGASLASSNGPGWAELFCRVGSSSEEEFNRWMGQEPPSS